MDDGNKESVSSNRKSPKKSGKRNLVKPQNTKNSCYKCGKKYQKGQKDSCKATSKTYYNCDKPCINCLEIKTKSSLINKQNWKFRSKNLSKQGQ